MAEFHHVSVLLEECLAGLKISPSGIYVDATLGGAGHSSAIAAKLSSEGHLVGIDQDPAALAAAEKRLAGSLPQITLLQGNFHQLGFLLEQAGIEEVDGVLFDLGVSSHQLDTAERGFSFHERQRLRGCHPAPQWRSLRRRLRPRYRRHGPQRS